MMMTNYNDGKWHTWGGEGMKPASVHSKSVIDYVWFDEFDENELCGITNGRKASDNVAWSQVVKFRVVKEHKEPREFWFYKLASGDWGKSDKKPSEFWPEVIHVREVTE